MEPASSWISVGFISTEPRWEIHSLAHLKIRSFVLLMLHFNRSLYVLGDCSLSDMSFANVFSQSVVFLFILLTVSFNFKDVQLTNSFMGHAFVFLSQKSLPNPRITRFPPVLACRSFIVLHFMLRSGPSSVNFYEQCKVLV